MDKQSKDGRQALISLLATCGGDQGPLFSFARGLKLSAGKAPKDVAAELPGILGKTAKDLLLALGAGTNNEEINQTSVAHHFGLPVHFHEMNKEAQLGMDSVARELPPDIRPVAHTLLPLKNGEYINGDIVISFRGLTALGPQKGNLVAHLNGVFESHCSDGAIKKLLKEQLKDLEFVQMARCIGTLDYEGTQLQKATLRAKNQLGL